MMAKKRTRVKPSVLRGRRKGYTSEDFPAGARGRYKVPTYQFVWCEKVDKSRNFGMDTFGGLNCSVRTVGKGVACEARDGKSGLCYESVYLYETGASPKYRRKK